MAATASYQTLAARRHGSQLWWYVTIGGVGHRADADGRPPTKFSTYAPHSSYTGYADFRDWLLEPPEYSSDVLHLADGSSTPGTCEFTIVDIGDAVAPSLAYWSLGKSVSGGGASRPTQLTADVTRTATTMTVNSAAGLSLNTMVFLDAEAVRITNIVGATVTITRGQWNTEASEHFSGDPVRPSARQLEGQLVEVYRNFAGLSATDEFLRWRGVVTDFRQTDDGLGWRVSAQSLLAVTAAEVCRRQGRYKASATPSDLESARAQPISIEPDDEDYSTFPDTTQIIWIASDGFDGAIRVTKSNAVQNPSRLTGRSATGGGDPSDYAALRLADVAKVNQAVREGCTIWEAFPVGQDLSNVRFPADDPCRIWLTWVLSRDGDLTRHATYDALPTGNGIERISASWVDVDAFEALGDALGVELPNLVYGMKGDGGFSLKEHAEKELFGPYRVIVATVDGVLTPIFVAPQPVWRSEGSAEITHDDIDEDTIPHHEPGVRDAIEHVTAKSGYDLSTGKPLVRQEAHLRKRAKWLPTNGRTVEYELHGYRPGAARSILKQVLTAYLHMHGTPPERVSLDLSDIYEHQIYPGLTIRFTSAHYVNAYNGVRGAEEEIFIVTSVVQEQGARLRVVMEAFGGDNGSISPAIRIDNVIATAPNATFDAELDPVREFTRDGVYTDYSTDDDWFLGGGATVGDAVAVVNGTSLAVRTTGLHITSITPVAGPRYRFTLDGASAGMVANDYLTFDEFDAANTTDRQKQWAYFSSGGLLGTGATSPYIYVA